MAAIVLGVVGNAIVPGIGGIIGAGVGGIIDAVAGSVISRRLLQKDAPPPDIREQPGVDAGTPAPWVHGSAVRVPGTVLYMSEVRARRIPGEEKGKAEGTTAGYRYTVDVAIAWCRNFCAIDPVQKIWASGELIYGINTGFNFDIDVYSIENLDRWTQIPRQDTQNGKPFCNRNRHPKRRKNYRNQWMVWLAIPGSPLDNLFQSIKRGILFTNITITGAINAANNGTFFCLSMFKQDYTYPIDPGAVIHNVYEVEVRRCKIEYNDPALPCEPDPPVCDPAVDEYVGQVLFNTLTVTVQIPNFSRYFTDIRNRTGDPNSPISANSLPNDIADVTIRTDPDIDENTVPAYRGTCYTVLENLDITKWAGTLPSFEALIRERFTATPETAVDALLLRSEAETQIEIDTEPLFDGVTIILGFSESGPAAPSRRIKELANFYDFEVQEKQKLTPGAVLPTPLLQFNYQADLPEVVIPYGNTSAREEGSPGRPHALYKRSSRDRLPQELSFSYSDIGRDFQINTTSYSVSSAPVQNRQLVSTGLVLTAAQADLITRKLMWKVLNFADQVEFETLPQQLELIEGDRFRFQFLADGSTVRGRVGTKTLGENGLIEIKGDIDDELAYEQNEGGGYAGDEDNVIDFASPGTAIVLDIPPLTAADASQFGVYIALETSRIDLTVTYSVFASFDQTNWLEIAQFSNPAITGSATTILGVPTDDSNWDEVNTVTVKLIGARTLESLTREEVAAGQNWAYIGGEIIGFTTATLTTLDPVEYNQDYILSGLLRGRNDTASQVIDHDIGDTFVLLPVSGTGVGFVPLEPARFLQPVFLRVAPEGISVLDAGVVETEQVFTPTAETLRPFSVHAVWAIRRPDFSTCVFATPRTRVPFRIWSGLIPPVLETGPATDFKANVYTLNLAMDEFVLRRQVEGCYVETRSDQVSFAYTREMILEDLVYTGLISDPDQIGETMFEIFRESDTIGEGRTVEFCVTDVGTEFQGVCTIEAP